MHKVHIIMHVHVRTQVHVHACDILYANSLPKNLYSSCNTHPQTNTQIMTLL